MAKRRKRKLKTKFKIILILLFVLFIFIIKNKVTNTKELNYGNKNLSLDYLISDQYESDIEIVETYFANGMKLDDFKSILNYNAELLKTEIEYKTITFDFNSKIKYEDVEKYLNEFNASKIVNLYKIGVSVDNRNIYGIEIGKGKKVVFLDANIHAAETANTSILLKFISEILNSYESGNNDIINALNEYTIAVMPCINPDGFEIYTSGIESINNKNLWIYKNKDKINFENIKSNANGVDINRNFPTQNAGLYHTNKSLLYNVSLEKNTSSTSYFGGYSLGSEPETKAAMYFMLKHYKNIVYYINFHSQGRVIYSGKPNLSDEFNNLSRTFATNISNINQYIVYGIESEEVGEGNDGSATDFMAEIAHSMPFSSKTLRLSADNYQNPNLSFEYKYPVLTLETIKTYTSDSKVFEDEYYNYGIRKVLFSLIDL